MLKHSPATPTVIVAQGDLYRWLLAPALGRDAQAAQAALAQAHARDSMILAGVELRQRALALHFHIPRRFTLSNPRPHSYGDVPGSWAATMMACVE